MNASVFILKNLEFKDVNLNDHLTDEDKKLIANTTTEKRKSELLFGRTLLRSALKHLNNPFFDKEVKYADSGKPFIKNSYEFSLSHSKDFVVVAVSANDPIGIDIQFKDLSRNIADIVQSYASDEEQNYFLSLNEQDRLNWFYKSWAAIEAAAKVNGAGISNFDRSFLDLNNVIAINNDYFLAVTGKNKIAELSFFKLLPNFEFSPIRFA